jgi:hypothetical protein
VNKFRIRELPQGVLCFFQWLPTRFSDVLLSCFENMVLGQQSTLFLPNIWLQTALQKLAVCVAFIVDPFCGDL